MPDDLHDLLDRTLDRQPLQPSAWEDVERARRSVRRRRTRLASAGGALAIAAGLVVTNPWPGLADLVQGSDDVASQPGAEATGQVTYVAPGWEPAAVDYQPESLSPEETLQRCNDKVYADGSYDGTSVDASHTPIHPGDAVGIEDVDFGGSLTDLQGNPLRGATGCVVPGTWTDPAPAPNPDPPLRADDTTGILRECSTKLAVDLRGWTVAAAMADQMGGVSAALVSPGQGYFAGCEIGGSWNETWIDNWVSPAAAHATPLTDEEQLGANSGPGDYSRAGILPAGMESATLLLQDGTELPVPVGVHGTYAIRLLAPGTVTFRTFDAAGDLVAEHELGS